jgi:hypothetical protein
MDTSPPLYVRSIGLIGGTVVGDDELSVACIRLARERGELLTEIRMSLRHTARTLIA